jgi:uncharacterized membrane protein
MPNTIDDIVIDVALMSQEHSSVEMISNANHIVHLDEIQITQTQFKQIFYPFGENFGLDTKKSSSKDIFPFVTFVSPYRSVSENAFSLLDQIISNLEDDLNVSRNCFTTYSLMELTNEITSIKTLYDVPVTSVLSSLSWSNILSVLNDFTVTKDMNDSILKPLFVVNVVFKTPNSNVKPTMIKFNYRITSFVL